MIKDAWIAGGLLVFLLGLGFVFRRQDNRRLKSRVLEAMSPSLRNEIEEERRLALERKNKFEEILLKSGQKRLH